jgi:hypothetical protein
MTGAAPAGTAADGGRVRHRERQPVWAADLLAEQEHRVQARRRHDRAQHRWGVVAGLELESTGAGLEIRPGVAVDGYGRSLVLRAATTIEWERIDRFRGGAAAVDLWLLYGAVVPAAPSDGYAECNAPRVAERPRLRLTTAPSATADPVARRPREVPLEALESGPESPAPESGAWPVYLGRLVPDGSTYRPEIDDRPQAGLVGEDVETPGGDVRMQVGGELPGDSARFAVELGPRGAQRTRHLAIDRQGAVRIRGDLMLEGTLALVAQHRTPPRSGADPCAAYADGGRSGDPWAPSAVGFHPLEAEPQAAAPWQVYRTPAGDPPTDELRFEIAHPGAKGDPATRRLSLGRPDTAGKFENCLSVSADCSLIVKPGSLTLVGGGQLIRAPAEEDLEDPGFAAAVVAAWLEAIARAGVKLDELYAGALGLAIAAPPEVPAGTPLRYDLTVSNKSPALVREVEVRETVTQDGKQVSGETLLSGVSLEPGASRTIRSEPTGNAAGPAAYMLAATASGTGPPGYAVTAGAGPVSVPVK